MLILININILGLPLCCLIKIGVKSGKGRNNSSIKQFLNCSEASSKPKKAWFSFQSAVESFGIEGAIFN
jgi:hypothetical protein